jgi:hypothetical protein
MPSGRGERTELARKHRFAAPRESINNAWLMSEITEGLGAVCINRNKRLREVDKGEMKKKTKLLRKNSHVDLLFT